MQPYNERAADVASGSQIAVMVLANPEFTDTEWIMLKPRPMSESERAALKARWPGRNLRSIGVIGVRGITTLVAFKEPLPPQVVDAVAAGFLAYVNAVLGDHFAEQMEAVEIAELERIYNYSDPSAPQV